MSKSRLVLYIGEQRDVFIVISNYFEGKNDKFATYDCRQLSKGQECLEVLENELDALVIIDFCEVERPVEFMQPLTIFKRWKTKASVAVGAIFNNKKQIKENEVLFGLGLNYAFIKGGDDLQALNSLFYIAYEEGDSCLEYAFAKGFKLPFKPCSIGYVSEFTQNSFLVDKDFKSLDEEVEMRLDLFDDFTATKFSLVDEFDMGSRFQTLYSASLRIEFASGWDTDEDALFEDTFTSWIGMNQDSFIERKGSVLIYGRRKGLALLLLNLSNTYPDIDFHLIEEFEEGNGEMVKISPDLVFFQIENEQSFNDLERMLIQMSYENVLNPSIVAVFGHPSSTEALRKLYGRSNLIATTQDIDARISHGMVERLKAVRDGQDIYLFDSKDQRLKAYFPLDAQVTSLTENEITFMTAEELPYYSVVKISEPFDMYAVIIPSLKSLSPNINGHHYMGLICGLESYEYNNLRKLVNHILDNGIDEWSMESLTIENAEGPPSELDVIENEKEASAPEQASIERNERPKSKNKLTKL
ncbi:MAG: hypothetical protein CME64_01985 [Halobacteriovoraceae bacterium]|nr:hypothetical protein [Halobacteriovoraceae bacterium]|tara:strand:+ start:26244 stop:27827 length:1584 start_codon:yes stop_codon:yes gene_type:complete